MPKKGSAIFLVYADLADPSLEAEFNDWYSNEHIPQLLGLPGFLDAARYKAVSGGPAYLAAYELESPDAIHRPEFTNRPHSERDDRLSPTVIGKNVTRILGSQIYPSGPENPDRGMAPVLQIGRMSVTEDQDADWNAWYNGTYIPGYRTVPGVIYARRFKVLEGERRYTTVYEFEHEKVPESPEWNHLRINGSPLNVPMREIMDMAPGSPGVYRKIT
ncbi:MAG: hypothetical protein ACKVVP_19585 [Chloroflexota bacterium]